MLIAAVVVITTLFTAWALVLALAWWVFGRSRRYPPGTASRPAGARCTRTAAGPPGARAGRGRVPGSEFPAPRPVHRPRGKAGRLRRGTSGRLPAARPAVPSRPQRRLDRVRAAVRGGPGGLRADREPAAPHPGPALLPAAADASPDVEERLAASSASSARRPGRRASRPSARPARPAAAATVRRQTQTEPPVRRGARLHQDRRQPRQDPSPTASTSSPSWMQRSGRARTTTARRRQVAASASSSRRARARTGTPPGAPRSGRPASSAACPSSAARAACACG